MFSIKAEVFSGLAVGSVCGYVRLQASRFRLHHRNPIIEVYTIANSVVLDPVSISYYSLIFIWFSMAGNPEPSCNPYIWVVAKMMVFFGYPQYEVPYYNRDPERDHNFGNHPYAFTCLFRLTGQSDGKHPSLNAAGS